ncbi:hypothetical protein JCGZ_06465 [Jatropha curcas]|uniref:Uncharacterized protein n=1 Tax=Jatropha curcas TaxID=180498 RepID=A0A067J9C2_JATCU|nr:hypothetical protein JCGZ_06465 [Jatropha curcas]
MRRRAIFIGRAPPGRCRQLLCQYWCSKHRYRLSAEMSVGSSQMTSYSPLSEGKDSDEVSPTVQLHRQDSQDNTSLLPFYRLGKVATP